MVCILLLDYFSFHVLTAVQHTGIGFDQISGILAELNMPSISRTLLSSRQEEIGDKIVGSGLSFSFLQLVYNRDSKEGIYNLFSENVKKSSTCYKVFKDMFIFKQIFFIKL